MANILYLSSTYRFLPLHSC